MLQGPVNLKISIGRSSSSLKSYNHFSIHITWGSIFKHSTSSFPTSGHFLY